MQGLLLVVCVSFLVFSLMYMMPGDPIDMVVDRKVSEERKEEIAHEMGYDQPFLTQYKNWVSESCMVISERLPDTKVMSGI